MILVHINVNDPFVKRASVYSHALNFNKKISVEFVDENGAIDLTNYTVTATFVCNGFLVAEDVAVTKESQTGVATVDITSTNSYTILPGEMLIEFEISNNGKVIYPVTAMVVTIYPSIRDDAQIYSGSYGTVSEILQEVAEARGNYNNLNARLDNIELNKMTFTNLGTVSSYDESIFQNNKNTGTVYAVNMNGTSYWFFNVKIGTDVSIQYRFSKNGIEVYNTVLQEWMNIGGKGGEIVTARKTFSTLGLRLDNIDSEISSVNSNISDIESEISDARDTFNTLGLRLDDMSTNIWQNSRAINQTIPNELNKKLNCKQATGNISTAFDNNLDLKTLYYIGRGLNLYYFLNLDENTQLRYNANQGFELREKVSDTWGEWTPAIADGSISNDMLNSALQSAIVLANRSIQYKFLGNVSGSDEASAFADNTDPKYIYRVGARGTYYDFINLSSSIQCRLSKFGLEVRTKTNDTWGDWTYLVKNDDRSKLLSMYNDFSTRVYMGVIDLGELGETTSLDNEDYCLERERYLFKAVNNLTGILHVPANTVCILTNANGYQIVEPVNIAVKIIRKVNAVRPTFNADPWEFITKTLNSGEVLWDNLAVPVKTRITDLESGKADYVNLSENPFTTAADFKDYDFQSDKCYQVFLYAQILGTYEPAQIALVFQSDWDTRIILGAKSGVFYSTYDSETEEWSDPVSSLDQATQRTLNNLTNRISDLETTIGTLNNTIDSQLNLEDNQ